MEAMELCSQESACLPSSLDACTPFCSGTVLAPPFPGSKLWERDSGERGLLLSRRDGLRERARCKLQVVNGML